MIYSISQQLFPKKTGDKELSDMQLWDSAVTLDLAGITMYRFGFFIALAIIAAAAVTAFLSWAKRCEKGTAPLTVLLSIVLGSFFSRLVFCLLNRELGQFMPFSSWFSINGGGWSMIGLIAGVMIAAWISARMTGQNIGEMMDISSCAVTLFMVIERIGEEGIPDFDYSRALKTDWIKETFLSFSDEYGTYLATWRLAAIVMGILFIILATDLIKSKKHGDTCILFLLLYGASTVILESLRYDRFLSISFVGLEQVLAAVALFIGIAILAKRRWKTRKRNAGFALALTLIAIGIGVGLEFALDRTNINRLLIYGIFIFVIFMPVIMGLFLRREKL